MLRPKIKEIQLLNIYREYLLCLQSNASGSFLQTCINFVEQPLSFSHFKGSIIPTRIYKIIRRIYENYVKIRIPYKYKTVIQNLSQNKNSVLLSQDKGKRRVKLDRTKWIEKCMNSINTDQFRGLENNPTKRTETQLQNLLSSLFE